MRGAHPDCYCDGKMPRCPPCVVAAAVQLRIEHPDSLSVSMLKRRLPDVTGHEAALLLEATKLALTKSLPMQAQRNGHQDGARYVEQLPLSMTSGRPKGKK